MPEIIWNYILQEGDDPLQQANTLSRLAKDFTRTALTRGTLTWSKIIGVCISYWLFYSFLFSDVHFAPYLKGLSSMMLI